MSLEYMGHFFLKYLHFVSFSKIHIALSFFNGCKTCIFFYKSLIATEGPAAPAYHYIAGVGSVSDIKASVFSSLDK